MKLSRIHQDTISRIWHDSKWSHKTTVGGLYVRKERGYNARTLRVLVRAGLVQSAVFQGPRGGRIVGIKLTEAGERVAVRISDIVEGTAPMDAQGSFIRTVTVGVTELTTYTIEGR